MSLVLIACLSLSPAYGQGLGDRSGDIDALPVVPDGFEIGFAAREPLVRNPSAMAFDVRGRMFIGMGPQYRKPRPDTPPDSIFRMIDADEDGVFESRAVFATGLNCIQGMAWHGRDLWVANAPDLTLVRDEDGDDVADTYIRIYTDLGNIEHGLHGLVWGPDGRLYMSKGNSKGLNLPGREAPRVFRDMWGMTSRDGAADIPASETFGPENYKATYQDPSDDWGRQGGVLVCDDMGLNLELVSAGFRNPWDIGFDSEFNFQGTDNDQNEGDRVFMPFWGAHFGWGHAWSSNWTGRNHLPTPPISGPVFQGSGTGIVFGDSPAFPTAYRGVWFFNDWLRKKTFVYRPAWRGSLMTPSEGEWTEFITPGDSLFKPTDLEFGPDGSLYVLGWGREYGVQWDDAGNQMNEGRIFRVRASHAELRDAIVNEFPSDVRTASVEKLIQQFDSILNARRSAAQDELIRRGASVIPQLNEAIDSDVRSTAIQTWSLWTIGRLIETEFSRADSASASTIQDDQSRSPRQMAWLKTELTALWRRAMSGDSKPLNQRLQSIRILGELAHRYPMNCPLREELCELLNSGESRVRFAGWQALLRAAPDWELELFAPAIAAESDRVTFYSAWQAVRHMSDALEIRHWLDADEPQLRLAAILALAESGEMQPEDAQRLTLDNDSRVREVASSWLAKGSGSPVLEIQPAPGEFTQVVNVELTCGIKPAALFFTTDGTEPDRKSRRWSGRLQLSETTELKVAIFGRAGKVGRTASFVYERVSEDAAARRSGVLLAQTQKGRSCPIVVEGLRVGEPVYSDRSYSLTDVPDGLSGAILVRTANEDAGSGGDAFLTLRTVVPMSVYIGHDIRIKETPDWLRAADANGFRPTGLVMRTNDAAFRVYEKDFDAGELKIGGNCTDGVDRGKSNYIIALKPAGLKKLASPTTIEAALAALPEADPNRGLALFFAGGGAGCAKCHRADRSGLGFGPDLSHFNSKSEPAAIVRSILEPSAEIKEGFATRTVLTNDGRTVSGLLREESELNLQLIQPDGRRVTIPKAEIEEQISQKVSAMPAFHEMLTPRQVADLTAWLLSRVNAPVPEPSDEKGFRLEQRPDRIVVHLNGQEFGTYLFQHKALTRPAWIHLRSKSGIQLTRNFPPQPGVDDGALDHSLMHPGLWISFGWLDGEDYWRLTSRTRHLEFVGKPVINENSVSWTVRNEYLRGDGPENVCLETTTYLLRETEHGVLMLIDARFQSDSQDFEFGDQEESGLAFRMESRLRVKDGSGRIINDRGEVNGKATWGKEARWVDYSGTANGRRVGIMAIPSPDNPRKCWMHTRDYGVVAVNPFPRQPKGRREPYVRTLVKQGDVFRLQYAVWLHDYAESDKFDRKEAFRIGTEAMKSERATDDD